MGKSTRLRIGWTIAMAFVAVGRLAGSVQAGPYDPVEQLRRVLAVPSPDLAQRDRVLREQVQRLQGVRELGRALMLPEWRADDLDSHVATVDRTYRTVLAWRFVQTARETLKFGDSTARLALLRQLNEMSDQSPALVAYAVAPDLGPEVARLALHAPPPVGDAAAGSLACMGADPALSVPAFGAMLVSPQVERRRAGARGLMGVLRCASAPGQVRSRLALVALAAPAARVAGWAAKDPDIETRVQCLKAVALAAELLVRIMKEPQAPDAAAGERRQREEELRPLRAVLGEQGPALAQALRDADPRVRQAGLEAADAIARGRTTSSEPRKAVRVGPPEAGVLRLVSGSGGFSQTTNDPALGALRPTLAAEVKDPNVNHRLQAIDVLESMGPAAAPAAPALVAALGDRDRFVRWAAARALGKMAPAEAATAVPGLMRLLDDADSDVRRASVRALGQYGPRAQAAVPRLIPILNDSSAEARIAAVVALRDIGPAARSAIPMLQKATTDSDSRVRRAAAELLLRLQASPAGMPK